MKQISTYSAWQNWRDNAPVESTTIIINKPLPKDFEMGEWLAFQDEEAQKIVDALVQALPGGVTNRVACLLMTRMVGALYGPLESK